MFIFHLHTTVSHWSQESFTFSRHITPFPLEQVDYGNSVVGAIRICKLPEHVRHPFEKINQSNQF